MALAARTFLFTDIEGSTRLWEDHPGAMRLALAQHDDLLRACIERNDGRVFKTIGDAFCAVFDTSLSAINAAIAAQLRLAAFALAATDTPLKVRMAIHTGMVEERDSDYFGPPLNRTARLLAIAHGGQAILSLAAKESLGGALPSGIVLQDRGKHRLRDLSEPEQVFQIQHEGLQADFPPLKSLSSHPSNLPQHLLRGQ